MLDSTSENDIEAYAKALAGLREGTEKQNWMEIRDLGFGFYRGGTFLPFTPYHDYDEDLFISAIHSLKPNERIVGVVRDSKCDGQDNAIPADPSFCWRVYSVKVSVYKVDKSVLPL